MWPHDYSRQMHGLISGSAAFRAPGSIGTQCKYWLHPRYLFRSKTMNLSLHLHQRWWWGEEPIQLVDYLKALHCINPLDILMFIFWGNRHGACLLCWESLSFMDTYFVKYFWCDVIGCRWGTGLETCLRLKEVRIDFFVHMSLKTLSDTRFLRKHWHTEIQSPG